MATIHQQQTATNPLGVKYIFARYFYCIGDFKEYKHVKTFSPHLRNN